MNGCIEIGCVNLCTNIPITKWRASHVSFWVDVALKKSTHPCSAGNVFLILVFVVNGESVVFVML